MSHRVQRRATGFLAVLGLCLLTGGSARAETQDQSRSSIMALFAASDAAWSAGQLDVFMPEYEDSPNATYVDSNSVITGRDAIRDHYRLFGSDPVAVGHLVTHVDTIRFLGADYALATGQYLLERPAGSGQVLKGFFTLVLHRSAKGWGVISDHS